MQVEETTDAQLAYDVRDTLSRVIRRLRAEPGPPVGQAAVLGRLSRGGPASVSQLASEERMRPQSMAQTVGDLEAAGLVTRRPDPADRRRMFVELTDTGRGAIEAMRAQREGWLAQTLERELDDRERDLLREALVLLGRIADA